MKKSYKIYWTIIAIIVITLGVKIGLDQNKQNAQNLQKQQRNIDAQKQYRNEAWKY